MKKIKIIVSGGGTGGHIYPAVAVVEALEEKLGKDNVEVLFVGALGKMEMEKVPALGYRIEGLPIAGLQRKISFRNLKVPFKVISSILKARKILRDFQPDVVVGFGGYASLPLLWQAQKMKFRTFIWEGNSFAGMANRKLCKGAEKIFVSYDGMEQFFSAEKIVKTGTPIRGTFGVMPHKDPEALKYFELSGSRPVIVITGGSLGARNINEAVMAYMDKLVTEKEVDVIWQVGSYYFNEIKQRMAKYPDAENIHFSAFVNRMDYAYSVSDLVIARSGASTVAEVTLSGVAALFVPSSGVTDDHQTKNAQKLAEQNAAFMLPDSEARQKMIPTALSLLSIDLESVRTNSKNFAMPNTKDIIIDVIVGDAAFNK